MRLFFKLQKQKKEHYYVDQAKTQQKIARQIREEIAEAIHASAERIAEIRKNSTPNRQLEELIPISGK
ncbi:MAG: hypothetical protein L6W00_30875 [Lentisphaeria bacterium]|nr:MAG: hypothetical protein L6W00_30875 [Lentisphaeria bacterium]